VTVKSEPGLLKYFANYVITIWSWHTAIVFIVLSALAFRFDSSRRRYFTAEEICFRMAP
jgi:hypothetical protein